jgi:tetratricopeptide (TPR) repeat protein
MVRGTVLGRSDDITLNASLVNVQNGEVAAAARARGTDAFVVVDQVSAELSGQILAAAREAQGRPGGLLAAELAPVAEITTQDIEAYHAYQEGLEAERRFRMAEAKAQYENAIQLDPGFALAHLRLGGRELEEGNNSRGIRALQLAKQNLGAASERDRLLIDGILALRVQDDADTAREKFAALLDRYPDDREARLWLWGIAEGDERQRIIEEAIRLDPYYAAAHNQLAYHLADKKEFAAADSVIARYASLEPDEPNPRDSRGEIHERAGEYEKARAQYREALEIEPTFLYALDHLARSYFREGRAAEARAELASYLPGPSPEVSARLRVLIGDAFTFQGAFGEALRSYNQAEEVGVAAGRPELRIEGLTSAAWLEQFIGRYAEASQTASVLYGIDPYNTTALRVAVMSAGERGNVEELQRLVEDVLRVLAESEAFRELGLGRYEPELLPALVRYYRGDPASLVVTFDGIKEELGAPLDLFVMWEEVWAHQELGNAERALGMLKNQKGRIEWQGRYQPLTNLRLMYEEGRSLELLGRNEEAAAAYQRLVSQLGDSLAEIPRLADTPERLAGLQGG